MYKDYKCKVKMVQKQWLQLKMRSLWGSNMKIVIYSRGNEPLMGGNKNLVGGGYCRKMFCSGEMNKILARGGTVIFGYWGDGGVPPVSKALIFRLLLFKACVRYFFIIFIFHQMMVLQKLCKMFFSSSKNLFSFSSYSDFCIFVFPSFCPVGHCFIG